MGARTALGFGVMGLRLGDENTGSMGFSYYLHGRLTIEDGNHIVALDGSCDCH